MTSTVVYERKSGKIVQFHHGSSGSKFRDVLRLIHPSHDRSQLATVDIEAHELQPGETYRINPDTQELERSADGLGSTGGAFRHVPDSHSA